MMLEWDKESPVSFRLDGRSVHSFERRFRLEDAGFILPSDRFRWSYLDEMQINVFAAIRRAGDEQHDQRQNSGRDHAQDGML
jgi:hypothetical protein